MSVHECVSVRVCAQLSVVVVRVGDLGHCPFQEGMGA